MTDDERNKLELRAAIDECQGLIKDLQLEFFIIYDSQRGWKTAARLARKKSGELARALKRFRSASMAAQKKADD